MTSFLNKRAPQRHEHGTSALLLLAALILLSLLWGFRPANAKIPPAATPLADAQTQIALENARAALLIRAATDNNRIGSLPCPDSDGDGDADLFAGTHCPSYLGRFPYKTLGGNSAASNYRDADGEMLWYALAPNFRDHPNVGQLTASTPGSLQLGEQGDIVAVIIAPGSALPGQSGRRSPNTADYLEASNQIAPAKDTGIGRYDPAPLSGNDRLLSLSRNDWATTLRGKLP